MSVQSHHDPHYWYSVEDGVKLLMNTRCTLLNFAQEQAQVPEEEASQAQSVKPGEEYFPFRENQQRIFLSDPYHRNNFAEYLKDDIARITATEQFSKLVPWQRMPTKLILPILSEAHWRVIVVEINYGEREDTACKVDIFFDDPYGAARFTDYLKKEIKEALKPNIEVLIRKTKILSDTEFILSDNVITESEKPIDQQGSGESSWDCGPITFSNIVDYIRAFKANPSKKAPEAQYQIPAHNAPKHDEQIIGVRNLDSAVYNEGMVPGNDRISKIKSELEKESQAHKMKLNSSLSVKIVKDLSSEQVLQLFQILENKRLFEGKSDKSEYTSEELVYAHGVLLETLHGWEVFKTKVPGGA